MVSFRDGGGRFHLDLRLRGRETSETPPALRFAGVHGVALAEALWSQRAVDDAEILGRAGLAWEVDRRPVMVPTAEGSLAPARDYRALVRPDTDQVMTVVTTAYRVAENRWVAGAALALAGQADRSAALIGAAGFGRTGERTLFVVRVRATEDDALMLLAYNSHGGEGAVRFRLVEADRRNGTVLAPDVPHAAVSVPHVGRVEERLGDLLLRDLVPKYLVETEPAWRRLRDGLWSPRHTTALVREVWGEPKPPVVIDGRELEPADSWPRHPGEYLRHDLADTTDAATAYRRLCAYVDNQSEACERGDLTQDRTERLALGAGMRLKERLWTWIVANT